jgi:hypothetical protein
MEGWSTLVVTRGRDPRLFRRPPCVKLGLWGLAMVDTRFEDGRAQRRDLTGIWTGAAAGALIALVVAVLVPLVGSVAATAVGVVFGACAGAWLGRRLIRRVSADDWEPLTSHRSFVGARAPDAEA